MAQPMTRDTQRGAVPWFLLMTIGLAIATGVLVYRALHAHEIVAAAERARAPKPVPKLAAVAATPELVEPTPVAEPDVPEQGEPTPPVAEDPTCDEVSCVLDNYERACCARYKRPEGDGTLPNSLDRAMISAGIAKVKPSIMTCGDRSSATGKVKVSVKVSGDGHVATVTVEATPDPALSECVAAVIRRAKFTRTANGGLFSYPFIF